MHIAHVRYMGQSYMYSLYCTQGLFYSFVLYNWEEIFFTVKGDSCLLFRTLAAFHWLKYWINLVTLSPSQLINIKPEVTYYFYRCLKIQGKYRIFFHSHPIPELGTRQYLPSRQRQCDNIKEVWGQYKIRKKLGLEKISSSNMATVQ